MNGHGVTIRDWTERGSIGMENLKGWKTMSIGFRLRNRFAGAALAGALVCGAVSTGCDAPDYQRERVERDAVIQQLEQRYSGNARVLAILEDQKMYGADPSRVNFLVANKIELELSADGLPEGAAIRLLKNKWQINPFLTAKWQGWAVNVAIDYAEGQIRDGLPYGVGESFALVGGALSPVGNNPAVPVATPSLKHSGHQP